MTGRPIKFHDADKTYRVLGRVFGWTCKEDGGYAFGLFGIRFWRLHREMPFGWSLGPFIKQDDGYSAFCSIEFVPAWKNHRRIKAKKRAIDTARAKMEPSS